MKNKIFYRGLIFFVLLCPSVFAQNSSAFIILEKGNLIDVSPYTEALEKADMDNYRLKNKRVKIQFNTGVVIELFSAQELFEMGKLINPSHFPDEFEPGYRLPEFSLGNNGFILALYPFIKNK